MIDSRVRRRDDIEDIARTSDPFMSPNHPTYQFLNRFPVFYNEANDGRGHNAQQQRSNNGNAAGNLSPNVFRGGNGNGPRYLGAVGATGDLMLVDSSASALSTTASISHGGPSARNGTWSWSGGRARP